jgi:hypothetical protein
MFDDFLRQRAEQTGEKFVPFDSSHDYAPGTLRLSSGWTGSDRPKSCLNTARTSS